MKLKIVIFGLSLTSPCENSHASQWRALCRALHGLGHEVVFFERVQGGSGVREELPCPGYCELVVYEHWIDIAARAERELSNADAGIVTSRCPDALLATDAIMSSRVQLRTFYDLDTPTTIDRVESGAPVPWLGPGQLSHFDLVLSVAGGEALDFLVDRLRAAVALPLFPCVDPEVHQPGQSSSTVRNSLSFLGTYRAERGPSLTELFLKPAAVYPARSFVVAGSSYPRDFSAASNVTHVEPVSSPRQPAFYASSDFTLCVRRSPKRSAFCPSLRLFEAAACGVPIIAEAWEGLERFFEPNREVWVARSTEDVVQALALHPVERARLATAARLRVLRDHSATERARQFVSDLFGAMARPSRASIRTPPSSTRAAAAAQRAPLRRA